jgi:hypothetical protein
MIPTMGIGLGVAGLDPSGLPSLVAWLDPRYCTQASGVVSSAENRARGRGAFPFVPATAGAPTWSATGFNGRPGFTFPGDHKLIAPIAPSFAGTPPAPGIAITTIAAVQPTPGLFGALLTTYQDGDTNSGYSVPAGISAGAPFGGIQRFDEAVNIEGNTYAWANIPVVMTCICDPVANALMVRINGVEIGRSTLSVTGLMNAQDHVVIGGESDAEDILFGPYGLVGHAGDVLVFASVLTPAQLLNTEKFINLKSGGLY